MSRDRCAIRPGPSTSSGQDAPGYYPPALTGMRGSHDGSFDVSHALRDGRFWARAGDPIVTGEAYDLVVVGGGISGLAAAYFYRARTSPDARILILDNHDDFGGHAKRNEFRPGGKLWIANGGTAGIESPFTFSKEALELMRAIGIDPPALAAEAGKTADRSVFQGLQGAYFFDKETFGADRLVVGGPAVADRGGAPAIDMAGVPGEDAAVGGRRSRASRGSRPRRSTTCRACPRRRRKIGCRG